MALILALENLSQKCELSNGMVRRFVWLNLNQRSIFLSDFIDCKLGCRLQAYFARDYLPPQHVHRSGGHFKPEVRAK